MNMVGFMPEAEKMRVRANEVGEEKNNEFDKCVFK